MTESIQHIDGLLQYHLFDNHPIGFNYNDFQFPVIERRFRRTIYVNGEMTYQIIHNIDDRKGIILKPHIPQTIQFDKDFIKSYGTTKYNNNIEATIIEYIPYQNDSSRPKSNDLEIFQIDTSNVDVIDSFYDNSTHIVQIILHRETLNQ
jgi:hypothetical protein